MTMSPPKGDVEFDPTKLSDEKKQQILDDPRHTAETKAEIQISDLTQQIESERKAITDQVEAERGGTSQRAAKAAQDRRRRQALGIFGRGDTVGPSGNVAPIGQRKTLLGE